MKNNVHYFFNIHTRCWYITPTIQIVTGDNGYWMISIMFLCITFEFGHRNIQINTEVKIREAEKQLDKAIEVSTVYDFSNSLKNGLLQSYIIRRIDENESFSYFGSDKFYAKTLNAKRFISYDQAFECLCKLTDEIKFDKKTSYLFSIEKHYCKL